MLEHTCARSFANAAAAGEGDGVDPYVGLLVDRTIGDGSLYHKVHLNVLYQFNGEQRGDERDGRYGPTSRLVSGEWAAESINRMPVMSAIPVRVERIN